MLGHEAVERVSSFDMKSCGNPMKIFHPRWNIYGRVGGNLEHFKS
jgi:hypothetical protein